LKKKQTMKIIKNIVIYDSVLPFGFLNKNTNRNNSISLFHTRCRFSGRAKANFNKFRMSRMIFKDNGENLNINGLTKASW